MKTLKASAAALAVLCAIPTHAEVVTNDKVDVTLAVFVPCANGGAGEVVNLSGPLHVLTSFTINGNRIRGMNHYQPQGIAGIGQSTGDTYRAVGNTSDYFNAASENGRFSLTFLNNFRIIGLGPGNNFQLHENVHLVVAESGELTSFHDNFRVECK
ncbi:hypothetical protein PE066_17220 [Ramlibacter tataouinensis]|uniref:hypothetical protein n=1 Tax=Ramlibacter tataouinensis TaxID=94132 RepID=UPI0022F3C8A9|nr:hypothetical protein [Ramlibacter tataouinensis]WBY01184.1 hypothetical protein PE066_17220 [Ramlibacter tataouinensis]